MGAIASQITSITIVYSTVYSAADQRKHQSSASLAFVREFPAQMDSNAENASIWWRHHGLWPNNVQRSHDPREYQHLVEKWKRVIVVSATKSTTNQYKDVVLPV